MLLWIIAALSALGSAGLCLATGSFQSLAWLWVLPVSFLGCFLALGALFFLVLWVSCLLVDLKKPQEKISKYYRTITLLAVSAILPIMRMKVRPSGLENIPADGRFLLVCNHLSDFDPVVLIYFFRKKLLTFISKWENSHMFLVGKVMHKLRCPLINRENDREALRTIIHCIQMLRDDECSVGVFPEGYTSMDGLLHEFRPGVFKIAQKAQVPIVVCTVQNTQHVFHNFFRFRSTTIPLHLVRVIPAQELQGVTAVEISRRVYQLMADDLGPDLVAQKSETT